MDPRYLSRTIPALVERSTRRTPLQRQAATSQRRHYKQLVTIMPEDLVLPRVQGSHSPQSLGLDAVYGLPDGPPFGRMGIALLARRGPAHRERRGARYLRHYAAGYLAWICKPQT